jgi:hypothetical protein
MPADRPTLESFQSRGSSKSLFLSRFSRCVNPIAGDRALLPPSSADMVLFKPGWADLTSANLTPASGRQDHTILPSAATSLVRVLLIAHRLIRTRPAITLRA